MWRITFIIYDTLGYPESGICCHLHWAQMTGGESKLTEFWCPIARRIIACPIISSITYLTLARGTDLVYPCSEMKLDQEAWRFIWYRSHPKQEIFKRFGIFRSEHCFSLRVKKTYPCNWNISSLQQLQYWLCVSLVRGGGHIDGR